MWCERACLVCVWVWVRCGVTFDISLLPSIQPTKPLWEQVYDRTHAHCPYYLYYVFIILAGVMGWFALSVSQLVSIYTTQWRVYIVRGLVTWDMMFLMGSQLLYICTTAVATIASLHVMSQLTNIKWIYWAVLMEIGQLSYVMCGARARVRSLMKVAQHQPQCDELSSHPVYRGDGDSNQLPVCVCLCTWSELLLFFSVVLLLLSICDKFPQFANSSYRRFGICFGIAMVILVSIPERLLRVWNAFHGTPG